MLSLFLETARDSSRYEAVARALVRQFEDPRAIREWPSVWLYAFEQIANFARDLQEDDKTKVEEFARKGSGIQAGPHRQGKALLNILLSSREPVVAAFGQVERDFPKPYELWWEKRP